MTASRVDISCRACWLISSLSSDFISSNVIWHPWRTMRISMAVISARATYLDAARRRDLGLPYSTQASVAKLVATDAAMQVTTDAVQVFGGVGYTRDFRVERFMREAKITQIFEGTNQIQRLVISRGLA